MQPSVAVVMPVLNEERHLARALDSVLAQDYPAIDEIVVALGPSRDRTAEILSGYDVTVVDNPSGRTPSALNAAIAATSAEVVVRVDAHCELPADHISKAVKVLQETGAAVVGGAQQVEGETPFERAVAVAMTSPLGVGSAKYHTGGEPGPAPSVFLGVFDRAQVEPLGWFDEELGRGQDWELNQRVIESGATVWFDPALSVPYRPRSSVRALAGQYSRTGAWRRQISLRNRSCSARYLAAPAMVLASVAGLALSTVDRRAMVVPATYLAGVTVGGLRESRGESLSTRAWAPVVFATMHWAWGLGFLGARSTTRPRPMVDRLSGLLSSRR